MPQLNITVDPLQNMQTPTLAELQEMVATANSGAVISADGPQVSPGMANTTVDASGNVKVTSTTLPDDNGVMTIDELQKQAQVKQDAKSEPQKLVLPDNTNTSFFGKYRLYIIAALLLLIIFFIIKYKD